jgi:hypothetical protein
MTSSFIGLDAQTNERVTISQSSRRQGLYIIGANGTGKTSLILHLVCQDIEQGLGVCVLDPHGDLVQDIIARLPAHREHDVILLDLSDVEYQFGLNLFVCNDLGSPLAVQYVVDQVMHVFAKLFGVTHETPLILEYLRNCTYTIVQNPGYTMAEIPALLLDSTFRKKLVANLTDQDTILFWKQYELMRPSDQVEHASSILRRVREFLQPLSRPIVGQAQTTLDFRAIMDGRKILLVKLDNRLEGVTSLIGSVIVALILNAAYSRSDLRPDKRKQFNLYADEFQRFATEDFATLLTEARKFGIATTIAHQIRDQLDSANKAASLNVANLIVFKISGADADEMAAEFDCTPPPPLLDKREKVLTLAHDVIGHLMSLHGHTNPAVREFVETYLRKLVEGSKMKTESEEVRYTSDITKIRYSFPTLSGFGSAFVPNELKRMLYEDFNPFLYTIMQTQNAEVNIPKDILVIFGVALGFSGSYEYSGQLKRQLSDEFLEAVGTLGIPLDKEELKKRIMVRFWLEPWKDYFKKFSAFWQEFWQKLKNGEYPDLYQYYLDVINPHTTLKTLGEFEWTQRAESMFNIWHALKDQFETVISENKLVSRVAHLGFLIKIEKDVLLLLPTNEVFTTPETFYQFFMSRKDDWTYSVLSAFDDAIDFVVALRKFMEALAEEPIMVDSGKWEMKPGTQRTYADVANEIASALANFPNHTARVKCEGSEHVIKTLPPERGLTWRELQERLDRIQAQTRTNYCRPRSEVEQEIATRLQIEPPRPSTKRTHTV